MSLSSQLKSAFGSGDRNRGEVYFETGAVLSFSVVGGLLSARVGGAYGHYSVSVDVEIPTNLDALHCTCRRFEAGYNCKHIWATILAHDKKVAKEKIVRERRELRTDSPASPVEQVPTPKQIAKQKKAARAPSWQSLLSGSGGFDNGITNVDATGAGRDVLPTKPTEEIYYVIDVTVESPTGRETLDLLVLQRIRKRNGEWSRLNRLPGRSVLELDFEDHFDQKIVQLLATSAPHYVRQYDFPDKGTADFQLVVEDSRELLESLIESGRFFWSMDEDFEPDTLHPIRAFDLSAPYFVRMEVVDVSKPKHAAELQFFIERAARGKQPSKRVNDDEVIKLADDGSGLLKSGLIDIENAYAIQLWRSARAFPPVTIKKSERTQFLQQLAATPGTPEVRLPASWSVDTTASAPQGLLKLKESQWETEFAGEIHFVYGNTRFAYSDGRTSAYDAESNQWVQRDLTAESRLIDVILEIPYLYMPHDVDAADHDFIMERHRILELVDNLGENGWEIILLGSRIKRAGEFDIAVESGQDWFDLKAEVDFDGQAIPLPSLLDAMARNEDFITLADGSRGRIPVGLLEQYAKIVEFGEVEEDGTIRFQPTQAMLLDAMLESKEGVVLDKGFKQLRKKLQSFDGIKPKTPTRGFQGELRKYQEDGLGWLHYLRDFGFGGCLADDMGLGKTIQVLALLESRRIRRVTAPAVVETAKKKGQLAIAAPSKKDSPTKKTAKLKKKPAAPGEVNAMLAQMDEPTPLGLTFREMTATVKRKPSIVVVPKSLIFNWMDEAAKFTPKLRFFNYTGSDRKARATAVAGEGFDVLITTYGTMRLDIAELTQLEFDYAILDESQAIKNSKAQCAKASRLLRADHRLAMTGTPIENHLGELWSLFQFLNPGMLGGARNFAGVTRPKKGESNKEREETLGALARAIQPFILRRTKEQVLTDLPPKTEQTLYCDMLPAQKKKYNELREYYRVKLAKKVATVGLGQAKIQVLEALLRLRQVACDPRLLDEKAKPGAKVDFLRQQIGEVVSEGHKVLVFSQFTSLLSLVRDQFDADGITYEYLDGKTRDRQACVRRFQNKPDVSAFLISLKAGGTGLNLTAADYVYLLDPWWNPAAESQAIDRAHRIGQQRPVIAYRMICRDTVEEKIVELQESKRELADSIIRADESLIRRLTSEDLTLLLG